MLDDDSVDEDANPVKKKKQIDLKEFFKKPTESSKPKPPTPSKISAMKPKPKVAPSKKPVTKYVESDEEDEMG